MKLEEAIQTNKFSSQKQKAGLNILYSAWRLKTLISRALKTTGLTHEQFNVLRILKGKHPELMCVRDIGSRMIERNSNVPRIIDRLVSKELVSRSTSHIDKRETVIEITRAGIEILAIANEELNKMFENDVTLDIILNELLETLREKK